MHNNDNGIAVVGIALRVPGAATPEQFWAKLAGHVESVRRIAGFPSQSI
jgi:acyl transferase domain-containing protein